MNMEIAKGTDNKKYRERMTKAVKIAGQMVIDMADDIVGNSKGITDLSIKITFDKDVMGSIPEVIITRSHIPKGEDILFIFEAEADKHIRSEIAKGRYEVMNNDEAEEES